MRSREATSHLYSIFINLMAFNAPGMFYNGKLRLHIVNILSVDWDLLSETSLFTQEFHSSNILQVPHK